MELHQWLDLEKGRASWLADQLGVSKTAVSLWRDSGVPLTRMEDIDLLTNGEVPVSAMALHAIKCKTNRKEEA